MRPVNCPDCGGRMEPGYLRAESFIGGAKWTRKKTLSGVGGEPLAGTDLGGNVYLSGHRCRACRVLTLRY